jgi:hypothetical protein
MSDCTVCSQLRAQLNILLASRPFDLDPWHDGQYSGLRSIIKLMDTLEGSE